MKPDLFSIITLTPEEKLGLAAIESEAQAKLFAQLDRAREEHEALADGEKLLSDYELRARMEAREARARRDLGITREIAYEQMKRKLDADNRARYADMLHDEETEARTHSSRESFHD